jgi:hypothetical protein
MIAVLNFLRFGPRLFLPEIHPLAAQSSASRLSAVVLISELLPEALRRPAAPAYNVSPFDGNPFAVR